MELSQEIERLNKTGFDPYEIVLKLQEKGVADSEIIKGINRSRIKNGYNGNLMGIGLIALAFILTFTAGYGFKLNDAIFKPFFFISFFLTGICLLVNRGYIGKSAKNFLITMLIIGIVFASFDRGLVDVFLYFIAIIYIRYIDHERGSSLSDGEILVDGINAKERKNELFKFLGRKEWKGSSISFFLILLFIFLMDRNLFSSMGLNVSKLLELTKGLLAFLLFPAVILSYINYKAAKILIFILLALCLLLLLFFLPDWKLHEFIIPPIIGIIVLTSFCIKKNLFSKEEYDTAEVIQSN